MKIPDILNYWFKIDEPKLWAITTIPVEEIFIADIEYNMDIPYLEKEGSDDWNLTPRMLIEDFANQPSHAWAVNRADTTYPIELYLHQDKWIILDWVHRFTKTVMQWHKTIKVRKISPDIAQATKRII